MGSGRREVVIAFGRRRWWDDGGKEGREVVEFECLVRVARWDLDLDIEGVADWWCVEKEDDGGRFGDGGSESGVVRMIVTGAVGECLKMVDEVLLVRWRSGGRTRRGSCV